MQVNNKLLRQEKTSNHSRKHRRHAVFVGKWNKKCSGNFWPNWAGSAKLSVRIDAQKIILAFNNDSANNSAETKPQKRI